MSPEETHRHRERGPDASALGRRSRCQVPDWLLRDAAARASITAIRVGSNGLHKSINLYLRTEDAETDCLKDLAEIAGRFRPYYAAG